MVLVWNPWGALGLVVVAATAVLAWFVYRAGPSRPVNRSLALLVVVEGVLVTACDDGVGLFLTRASDYYAVAQVHAVAHIALPFLYLGFLAKAVDSPLVRPLQNRWAGPALLAGMLAWQAYRALDPAAFVPGLAAPWYAHWGFLPGPAFVRVLQFGGVVSLYGLAATFDAWRRAPLGPSRERARAYAWAFGFHDLYWAILLLVILPYTNPYAGLVSGAVFMLSMPLLTLAFVGLLGYGLLRTQMLDIELRLKWTLRQSTVLAFFLAAFFVVSELAALWLSDAVGSVVGILAAGALLFLLAPLQRVAERVSDAAMPGVRDTDEYRTVRKREVYRATVEGALVDGKVTERERDMLARLQDELGLTATEARAIERKALAATGGFP